MNSSWQGMDSWKRISWPLTAAPSRSSLCLPRDPSQSRSKGKRKGKKKTRPRSTNSSPVPWEVAMLDRRTVFEVHRLRHEGWPKKKIATTLHLSPKTVRKYLQDPTPERISLQRASKLDPFRE